MMTTRKNATVKALQAVMARAKKTNTQALIEWEISCNTNNNRGNTYDQNEINRLYDRNARDKNHGATKVCHLKCHNGNDFEYIVIKRFRTNGADIQRSNQLIDEIKFWETYAEKPEIADILCPVLKYFTSKSDKVGKTSETMKNNVVIIAQKAVFVDDARTVCDRAEYLNRINGYVGENAVDRYTKLKKLADKMGWWDVLRNDGNSGVIFDYNQNCYKAVFIDYAL